MAEFLEITFSRHGTFKLLCDTSLALARSSPTRRYTGLSTVSLPYIGVKYCKNVIHTRMCACAGKDSVLIAR